MSAVLDIQRESIQALDLEIRCLSVDDTDECPNVAAFSLFRPCCGDVRPICFQCKVALQQGVANAAMFPDTIWQCGLCGTTPVYLDSFRIEPLP